MLQQSLDPDAYLFAWQHEQLGTAHAAIMAVEHLKGATGNVIVSPGDTPLLDAESLGALLKKHRDSGSKATIATFELDDPTGYGRIVRDGQKVVGIVEHKDATQVERAIREVNSAVYCFDIETLLRLLPTVTNDNAQQEYYLTDVIKMIATEGGTVETLVYPSADIFRGVNDRWQLAEASQVMRMSILKRHALNGVSIVDPQSTFIGADVEIEPETVIHPMTALEGRCKIGAACHIGPQSILVDCEIGDECTVLMSHVNRAVMEDGSRCGPYAHLRPKLGESVSVGHLTYLGDVAVGAGTNVGAGTITCNFDGVNKHRTEVGENVFIGSNSTLIAPVKLGTGSYVGAGSVVTHDVQDDALALGRAKQVEKEGWARQRRQKMGQVK
jgi:bifunctional UDP-N-acetylglucosamine pyrophosphorylase/glucosamine-1-phosphate N-acetyltransferase